MIEERFIPPKTFRLGFRTWKVKLVNRSSKWLGRSDGIGCKIELNMRRIKSNDDLRHTFYHELMHAIFYTMGQKDLHEDECLIDALSNMLAQFETSRDA